MDGLTNNKPLHIGLNLIFWLSVPIIEALCRLSLQLYQLRCIYSEAVMITVPNNSALHSPAITEDSLSDDTSCSRSSLALPDLLGEHYSLLLRRLHDALRPQTYVEVGCSDGSTLAMSTCASIAVDSSFQISPLNAKLLLNNPCVLFYQTSSNEFFSRNNVSQILSGPVDLAFLDGLHHCEHLLQDFINTERHCRPNSIIMLHDCLPTEIGMAMREPHTGPAALPHRTGWWTGDVWRTALLLKRCRPDLDIAVYDAHPTGLVIVTRLNPDDNSLESGYTNHVRNMMSWNLTEIGLGSLFAELEVDSTSRLATNELIRSRYKW